MNPIDLPIADDSDLDSDATINYDDQNLNYTEYWATQKRLEVTTIAPPFVASSTDACVRI